MHTPHPYREEAETGSVTLRAPDISCGHCVESISSAVGQLEGVSGVRVDLEGKRVDVEGEALEPARIAAAIREAGYEPVER